MKAKYILASIALSLTMAANAADLGNSIEMTQLYIVGAGTDKNWDLGNAYELDKIDYGVFQWTGTLNGGGDFKFMNTREWHKHIVSANGNIEISVGNTYPLNFYSDWTLDGSKDTKFHVATTGTYTLTVDLNSMRMSISEAVTTAQWPAKFYLTGSAMDNAVVEMADQYGAERKASVYLKPGELKLRNTANVTTATRYYSPTFEGVDVTFGDGYYRHLYESSTEAGSGWSVSIEGYYNIYLDNSSHTYLIRRIVPIDVLYLVGGCCEKSWNYWDQSNCLFTPSGSNPYVMVWEGDLRIGYDSATNPDEPNKFKILTKKSWFDATYHPYVADAAAVGTTGARISGGDDLKWSISTNGRYRLELNILTEKLTGTLIEAYSSNGIDGDSEMAGVEDVATDHQDATTVYYDLQGNRISRPERGIYIAVTGNKARKIINR